MTTNVKFTQLNYNKYEADKYDRDIINSIPFHKELHKKIKGFVKLKYKNNLRYNIIDLGVGTGITSKLIKNILPNAHFDVVDFSKQMIKGAHKKLGNQSVKYIIGDYAKLKFNTKYDIAVSVIGIHHQSTVGKKRLFKKIHSLLKPKGIFIYGDLVTFKNKYKAAYNNALHYHHLVEHATDRKTLGEWAHHHQYLNDLAPLEEQVVWLKSAGFKKITTLLLEMNTALLVAQK